MMMRIEDAVGRFDEGVAERIEALLRAIPGETVGAEFDARAEIRFLAPAHNRIGAVCPDDQVGLAEIIDEGDTAPIKRFDSDGARARLKDLEQAQAANSSITHAVDAN